MCCNHITSDPRVQTFTLHTLLGGYPGVLKFDKHILEYVLKESCGRPVVCQYSFKYSHTFWKPVNNFIWNDSTIREAGVCSISLETMSIRFEFFKFYHHHRQLHTKKSRHVTRPQSSHPKTCLTTSSNKEGLITRRTSRRPGVRQQNVL